MSILETITGYWHELTLFGQAYLILAILATWILTKPLAKWSAGHIPGEKKTAPLSDRLIWFLVCTLGQLLIIEAVSFLIQI